MCSGVCQPLKLHLHSALTPGCERIGAGVGGALRLINPQWRRTLAVYVCDSMFVHRWVGTKSNGGGGAHRKRELNKMNVCIWKRLLLILPG